MNDYLKYEDYVPIGLPLDVGKTVSVVHCKSSSGGRDDACYVTKQEGGIVVAFCHRCGKKGKYTPTGNDVSIESIVKSAEDYIKKNVNYGEVHVDKTFDLPEDTTRIPESWPPEARSWVFKNGLVDSELAKHKVCYCAKLKRVLLPVHSRLGALLGYISRKIFDTDKYPKYLMHKPEGRRLYKYCSAPAGATPFDCVLTEDILSAIKCARVIDSYAILGVNIPTQVLRELKMYKRVFIFLDNDNDVVKKKQIDLRHLLLSFVDEVILIEADKDPKEHTTLQLRALFRGDSV